MLENTINQSTNIKGLSVCDGQALGCAIVLKNDGHQFKPSFSNILNEKNNLEKALHHSKSEIDDLILKIKETNDSEKAQIFEAHKLFLTDPEILKRTIQLIEEEKSAFEAYETTLNEFIHQFEQLDDAYFRERAMDLKDVKTRVLAHLSDGESSQIKMDMAGILVATELTPSQTMQLCPEKILGIITEKGGETSHTAILARSLGIPLVSGIKVNKISDGETLWLDGTKGEIILNPSLVEKNIFKKILDQNLKDKLDLFKLIDAESKTLCGKEIILRANMANLNDLELIKKTGAKGIGLFRTEFLFMNRSTPPSEEEQFLVYQKTLKEMAPNPVVIRTLDVGGDKNISYINIEKEENPFLGKRAIRLCFDQLDLFKTQLKAILRASIYGELHLLIPFITEIEEVIKVKGIIEEVKKELTQKNVSYSKNYKFGIMIEIPSAALMTLELSEYVDFFSIGTNDLIQYTCAVDRMNPQLEHLYSIKNGGVLKLITQVLRDANSQNIPVEICGEAASDRDVLPYLIKKGLRELSVSAPSILPLKKFIRSLNIEELPS